LPETVSNQPAYSAQAGVWEMPSVQSVWNAVEPTFARVGQAAWNVLGPVWNAVAQSPHLRLYTAAAAGLVFLLLVVWVTRGRAPATLSLNQPGLDPPRDASRRRAAFNQSPLEGLSLSQRRPGAITPGWAEVTPIQRGASARCTHCNAPLAGNRSFCDECGFAQPMLQTGTGMGR
jgi:hypothetical protein